MRDIDNKLILLLNLDRKTMKGTTMPALIYDFLDIKQRYN